MTPIQHIRTAKFKITQAEFAEIASTTQASVSRWENGVQAPDQIEMARIRNAARDRGIAWDDRWFFETPSPEAVAS